MKGLQSLGDAVNSSLRETVAEFRGEEVSVKQAGDPSGAQLAIAVARFRVRCASLGMSPEMTDAAIARSRAGYADAMGLSDSPIERRLLPWLIFEDYGPKIEGPARVHVPTTDRALPAGDIVVVPQFRFGRYKLDFLVVARVGDRARQVAVECDGGEYHDAAQDRERDAYFESWSIPTVRAGGQEIHAAPQTVSARVADIIIEWAETVP